MLARLETGYCFYCAAGHCVPGWVPGLHKPARRYRMCMGSHRQWSAGEMACACACVKMVEWTPMVAYSNSGRVK